MIEMRAGIAILQCERCGVSDQRLGESVREAEHLNETKGALKMGESQLSVCAVLDDFEMKLYRVLL